MERIKVRAQRKFAQKRNQNSAGPSNMEKNLDQDVDAPTEAIFRKSKLPAKNLLDQVAFHNIHNHSIKEFFSSLKDVRVVLDRLPTSIQLPDKIPSMHLRSRSVVRVPPKKRKAVNSKNRKRHYSSSEDDRPLSYYAIRRPPQPSTSGETNNAVRIPSRELKINIMRQPPLTNLKTHQTKTNKNQQPPKKRRKIVAKKKIKTPCRRSKRKQNTALTRAESLERDNSGAELNVNHLIRNASPKEAETPRMYSVTVTIDKAESGSVHLSETESLHIPIDKVETESLHIPNDKVETESLHQLSNDNVESESCLRLFYEEDSDIVAPDKTFNPLDVDMESSASATPPQPQEANNNYNHLADFIRNIFNWVDDDDQSKSIPSAAIDGGTTEPDNNIDNLQSEGYQQFMLVSQKKVQDWLTRHEGAPGTSTAPPASPEESQFKIPQNPAPRVSRCLTGASSSVCTGRFFPVVSQQERTSRRRCIAWSYEGMTNIATDPSLIERFCLECTRCKIMFIPTCLNLPSTQTDKPSGSGIIQCDIYDFNSERDGNYQNPITPYRQNVKRNMILHNISKHPEYLTNLKRNMTEQGRKIFRIARIMNDNIQKGVAILPRDHMLLAQVIGILTESTVSRGVTPESKETGNQINASIRPATERSKGQLTSTMVDPSPDPALESATVLSEPFNQDLQESTSEPPVTISRHTNKRKLRAEGSEIPRKRTRQAWNELELRARPATPQTGNGTMKSAMVVAATKSDFKKSPTIFAMNLKEKYPNMSFCGIKPPCDFKPKCDVESAISHLKLRSQLIHKMLARWAPITKELTVMRSIQYPKNQRSPLFDGLEIDLVNLYHAVREEKGFVSFQNDPSKWSTIAKKMRLPNIKRTAAKLENIYLKCLLPYETLTHEERVDATNKVEQTWQKRQNLALKRAENVLRTQENILSRRKSKSTSVLDVDAGEEQEKNDENDEDEVEVDDDEKSLSTHLETVCAEAEECVTPGRVVNLSTFKKLAHRVYSTFFEHTPGVTLEKIEETYWYHVMEANKHICVYSSSIDAKEHGYGFPSDPMDPYISHPWNLKHLSVSSSNLLKHLGPTLGVSSPTIHYGMTFSTSCWHMDPTMVPWIEYLHHGAPKIWYSISADQSDTFRTAAYGICPSHVQNKGVWLPCDIAMIPPRMLMQRGLHVERHVQNAGEFVIVFPNTFYACLDTGFCVSEGVYFAPETWITNAETIFTNLRINFEPSLFSLPKLLISLAESNDTPFWIFRHAHNCLSAMMRTELVYRERLANFGIEILSPEMFLAQHKSLSKSPWQLAVQAECRYCRCTLDVSRMVGLTEGKTSLCLEHGLLLVERMAKDKLDENVYCISFFAKERILRIMDVLDKRMRAAATQVTELASVRE